MSTSAVAASAKRKAYVNIVLPLFITSIIAYMDRVNLSYAELTMNEDLGFTEEMYRPGCRHILRGLFPVRGSRGTDRRAIQSEMVAGPHHDHLGHRFRSDGLHHDGLAILRAPIPARRRGSQSLSGALRFLHSAVVQFPGPSAGHRLMLTSLQVSNIIGAPLAGWLLGVPLFHFRGGKACSFSKRFRRSCSALSWCTGWRTGRKTPSG